MVKRTEPGAEMPFLDHLEELRWRLIYIIGTLFVGAGLGFFATQHFQLITLLAHPVESVYGAKLVYTHPVDGINAYMMLSLTVGIILASPVILYQLWAFVAPALFPKEKKVAVLVLAGGLVLFLAGVALSFFFVLPATMRLSQTLGGTALTPMITVGEYFSFITTLALTFGAAFELPLLVMALAALGLVTPRFLRQYRRHAFVLCVVGAALITPGDAVSATLGLMLPLYLLYELGILLSVRVYRWRERREAAADVASEAQETA